MDRTSVLLDTDIGSDIDDAVALAYLLRQPKCDLLGITTVSGDVQKRAALAEITCRAAGREDIPIHCGRRDVLLAGVGQPNVPQYESVAHLRHNLGRPENTAVPFLREVIRSRPGEVVLLTIGPFSNVALLFALDLEIPFLLKGLVSMAGCFYEPLAEWNCRVDTTATAMTFAAARRQHRLFGLDVTRQVTLSQQEVSDRFTGHLLGNVALQAERWFEHAERLTFHDPLAAACIFNPEICTFETGKVDADPISGTTSFTAGQGSDVVANTVDARRFFEVFWSVFA
jgi:purine nucleosidase